MENEMTKTILAALLSSSFGLSFPMIAPVHPAFQSSPRVRLESGVRHVTSFVVNADELVIVNSDIEVVSSGDITIRGPIIGHRMAPGESRSGVSIILRSQTRIYFTAPIVASSGIAGIAELEVGGNGGTLVLEAPEIITGTHQLIGASGGVGGPSATGGRGGDAIIENQQADDHGSTRDNGANGTNGSAGANIAGANGRNGVIPTGCGNGGNGINGGNATGGAGGAGGAGGSATPISGAGGIGGNGGAGGNGGNGGKGTPVGNGGAAGAKATGVPGSGGAGGAGGQGNSGHADGLPGANGGAGGSADGSDGAQFNAGSGCKAN